MSDFAHCCNGGDTVHPWVGYDEATCPLCEARSEIARLQAELDAALAPDGGKGVGAFRRCYDRLREENEQLRENSRKVSRMYMRLRAREEEK